MSDIETAAQEADDQGQDHDLTEQVNLKDFSLDLEGTYFEEVGLFGCYGDHRDDLF